MLKQQLPLSIFLAILIALMAVEFVLSSNKMGSLVWDAFFLAAFFAGAWMRRRKRHR